MPPPRQEPRSHDRAVARRGAEAGPGDERHRLPGNGRKPRRIEPHRADERLIVFDIEFQFQAGKIGLRQVFQPLVVEMVLSVPHAQDCEVVGGLQNDEDGHTRLGRAVHFTCRCATGEALQLRRRSKM